MDGKGRYRDNIFVERLWSTVKYEEVVPESLCQRHRGPQGTGRLLQVYNSQRPHQALGYRTPAEVFHQARNATGNRSKVTEGPPERRLVSLA